MAASLESGDTMPACEACNALDGAPVDTAPHANLLLYTAAEINFWETATGSAEFYVCHACGATWERDIARSEPDAVWKPSTRPLP